MTATSRRSERPTPARAPAGAKRMRNLVATLSAAIEAVGQPDLFPCLLDLLASEATFDCSLVMAYRPDRRPHVLVDKLTHSMRRNSVQHYVNGAYLIDPFYIAAQSIAEPSFVQMRDIAPSDFRSSEYFVTYYQHSNLVDEVNYLVPLEDDSVLAVCIERSVVLQPFGRGEIRALKTLTPIIAALLISHRNKGRITGPSGAESEHKRLEGILERFGSEVLTSREHEVLQLMIRGNGIPGVARVLHLSVETVRVHRRNMYRKLGISSLYELFALVLEALYTARSTDIDPLREIRPGLPAEAL